MTVTVAGVSNDVSPSRVAMPGTAPLLSGGVCWVGCLGGAVGAGARAGTGARRVVWVSAGVEGRACRVRGGAVTSTGGNGVVWGSGDGNAVCATPGSVKPSQRMERSASDDARGERADAR